MKEYFSIKFTSRYLTIIIAFAHFLIISVGFFSFISYQRAASDLIVHQDSQLAFSSAIRLNKELMKYVDELNVIAHDPDILGNNSIRKNEKFRSFENRLSIFDTGIVFLDYGGVVQNISPFNQSIIGQDWSDYAFFTEQLKAPRIYFSDALKIEPIGKEAIVISVPLLTSGGEFKGVLAGLFQLGSQSVSSFYASIVKLRIGLTGNTYLLDGNQRVIYDSAGSDSLASHSSREFGFLVFDEINGAYRTRDEEGNLIIAAYSHVPDTDWVLVIEDDWKILNAPIRNSQNIVLGFLGFGMVLPAISVVILARMRNKEESRIDSTQKENFLAEEIIHKASISIPPVIPGWDFFLPPNSENFTNIILTDFYGLTNGQIGMTVAYMKKGGVQSALMLNSLKSLIQCTADNEPSLSKIGEYLNKTLFSQLSDGMTIDCFLAHLNIKSGLCHYCYFGFPNILLSSSDATPVKVLGPLNQELGKSYDLKIEESSIDFLHGTKMFLLIPDEIKEITNYAYSQKSDFSDIIARMDFSSLSLEKSMSDLQRAFNDTNLANHQIFSFGRKNEGF